MRMLIMGEECGRCGNKNTVEERDFGDYGKYILCNNCYEEVKRQLGWFENESKEE